MIDDQGPAGPVAPAGGAEQATFARLADRITRISPRHSGGATAILRQVEAVDQAIYAAVARTPTPSLDRTFRALSRAADNGVLWMGIAASLAVVGGPRGRRAALAGLASQGVASAVANLGVKPIAVRSRPTRDDTLLVAGRQVRMPHSRSFPSGHTASAFAFATGATEELPLLSPALYSLAGLVGYSRVHTGVHFPLDVVIGATLGMVAGEVTGALSERTLRRRRERRRATR